MDGTSCVFSSWTNDVEESSAGRRSLRTGGWRAIRIAASRAGNLVSDIFGFKRSERKNQHSPVWAANKLILLTESDFFVAFFGAIVRKGVAMQGKSAFELQLEGYGLTTAHILYRMPDHPGILQTYVWQDYDLAPEFPQMYGFLDFWENNLDGPLHSVRYSHQRLIKPGEFRRVDGEIVLH
jgi:uncharacterized protein Usg